MGGYDSKKAFAEMQKKWAENQAKESAQVQRDYESFVPVYGTDETDRLRMNDQGFFLAHNPPPAGGASLSGPGPQFGRGVGVQRAPMAPPPMAAMPRPMMAMPQQRRPMTDEEAARLMSQADAQIAQNQQGMAMHTPAVNPMLGMEPQQLPPGRPQMEVEDVYGPDTQMLAANYLRGR